MQELVKTFNLQVDLAVEARDMVRVAAYVEIQGVIESVEELENHVTINTIIIRSKTVRRRSVNLRTYVNFNALA